MKHHFSTKTFHCRPDEGFQFRIGREKIACKIRKKKLDNWTTKTQQDYWCSLNLINKLPTVKRHSHYWLENSSIVKYHQKSRQFDHMCGKSFRKSFGLDFPPRMRRFAHETRSRCKRDDEDRFPEFCCDYYLVSQQFNSREWIVLRANLGTKPE